MWVAPEISTASVLQVLSRYLEAWGDQLDWAAFAVGFFVVARRALRRPPLRAHVWRAGLTGIALVAVGWALHLGWIADDAFISFRYSRNWVNGAGLVFNPGERVEGYTNFLWVVLLSPFEAIGLPLGPVSVALTSICLVSTLLVTATLAGRLWNRAQRTPASQHHLPIASALLGLNYVFASFGTSGSLWLRMK